MRFSVLIAPVALALLCYCAEERSAPEYSGSTRKLGPEIIQSPVLLDGSWELRWHDPNSQDHPNHSVDVPGAWNNQLLDGKPYPSYGKGSYSLTLLVPRDAPPLALYSSRQGTAWRILVDGVLIGESGQVGERPEDHRPAFFIQPTDIPVALSQDGELELTVEISNFTDRSGGMWNPFFLGTRADIHKLWLTRLILDVFTFAAIVSIGLYHLALFLSRTEDRASLAFALVCLIIAVRVASTGEHVLEYLFPELGFEFVRKLEFLSFYLAVPAFLSFLMFALNEPWKGIVSLVVWPVAFIFSLVVLFFPLDVYSHTLVYFFAFFAICFVVAVTIWIRSIFRRDPGALASLIGGVVFALSAIHDMLYASEIYITTTGNLAGLGLIAFLLTQSYLLARIFSRAFRQTKTLTDTLLETNRAYARFVPTDFLNHLNHSDIRQVRLGDQTETEMSILFTDIRAFTELSEKMTPGENFQFLNSYLKRVVPCITEEGGFVDKYIGDAIMALFSGPPERALRAAIAIQREVRLYNQDRQKQGYDPISVGIGLHYGRLMLGTIGSEERMESTVISDAVNTASRIERLTRDFESPILISHEFRSALHRSDAYHMRLLGEVQVKGKSAPIPVYEVLDGQPQWVLDLFIQTRESFEQAVKAWLEGRRSQSRLHLEDVLRQNPADPAAGALLRRLSAVMEG